MSIFATGFTRRSFLLIAAETVLIVCAVAAGAWIRLGSDTSHLFIFEGGLEKALVIALVCQVCLYYSDLYTLRLVADRRELFVRTVQAIGATSFLLAGVYYAFPSLIIGRGVFVYSSVLVFLVITGWRVAFEWLTQRASPSERLLVVGTGPGAVGLARELFEKRHHLGVELVGFIDPDPANVGAPVINPGVIGTVEDIPSIVRARSVDRVVVSLSDARGKLPMDKLLEMKLEDGVRFDHLASVYEQLTGKIAIENLRPSWLVFSSGFRKSALVRSAKRAIDVGVAVVALVVLAPLMLLIAAVVKLTSPGPVLYHQKRVGQHGAVFTVHKFRTMRADAEAQTGAVWARVNDDRVTPVGRAMRRSRLDELPQLWNILRGDMSLVGPRPERPEFVRTLTEQIPFYGQRHVVRPGLTGWAQVRYTYGSSVEDAMEKLQYDLFYIKNLSLPLDLFIAFSTIKIVVLRRGA